MKKLTAAPTENLIPSSPLRRKTTAMLAITVCAWLVGGLQPLLAQKEEPPKKHAPDANPAHKVAPQPQQHPPVKAGGGPAATPPAHHPAPAPAPTSASPPATASTPATPPAAVHPAAIPPATSPKANPAALAPVKEPANGKPVVVHPATTAGIKASNEHELSLLAEAYALLAHANRDYNGNRVAALRDTEAASRSLGRTLNSGGGGGEAQAQSDAQLERARNLLEMVHSEALSRKQPDVIQHTAAAVSHIDMALKIR